MGTKGNRNGKDMGRTEKDIERNLKYMRREKPEGHGEELKGIGGNGRNDRNSRMPRCGLGMAMSTPQMAMAILILIMVVNC